MMPDILHSPALPDAGARQRALLDYQSTLLVEAGAGTGKTALMAGRVALMLAYGIQPRDIVAITFTEAAASELLERIQGFVASLRDDRIPPELQLALPNRLSVEQRKAIAIAAGSLDEITCTTIHGFCQQLIKPYPIEATIVDPAAADLAYHDPMTAWLSTRFGRVRDSDGLGRIPLMTNLGSENDFFAELIAIAPDQVVALIAAAANFLRCKRTAQAPGVSVDIDVIRRLSQAIRDFTSWYAACGIAEPATTECVDDLARLREMLDDALNAPITGRVLARLLMHEAPACCRSSEPGFKAWRNKGKWQSAAAQAGFGRARGEQLSATAMVIYESCGDAYATFTANIAGAALARFVSEFDGLRDLYADYKRQAALLDFDDLLHHARDLLARNVDVRQALARRYPRILVDEFQDTDPLQAEILWLLCGDGNENDPWTARRLRAGSLFLVGDPKQAIYRFRGADVDTYLLAKRALLAQDPRSILEITANFRSTAPILEFANTRFQPLLSEAVGQPGFTPLEAMRATSAEALAVACFDVPIDDSHKDDNGKLNGDLVREHEATIVAEIVQRLVGNYQIWDKRTQQMRVCRAGDIALLAPTGASLWRYERALEYRHVPVASQAGKGSFRRQEIQDLIALSRAIADRRDTLAFGALLRGPLVGLSEEEIADAIAALPARENGVPPQLHLWTDRGTITHPILGRTLEVLQNLARKARTTTPYQILAEAIEELNIRPMLRARFGVYQGTRWALGDVLWRWRWVGLGIAASKKGAALLEGMVHAGSTCLRRVAEGRRRSEVRFNRFLANPKVTVKRLVEGWSAATGAAIAGRHVLAIQDTSEINFRTTRTRTRGLGEIGKGVGRGALLHAMVAVDAESQACLGLVAGEVWTRCGRVDVPHQKRPLEQKESRRWIETARAGKRVLESAATVTMVADREADLYALWALMPEPGVHVLGRIHHDRSLVDGGTLTTIPRQWPVAGRHRVRLRERLDRLEREARLELRFGVVTIARPRDAGAPGLPAQVTLSLIELTEPDPPQGVEPITWRLLTTHPVATAAAAWQIVGWYRARWVIEQLFRLLKKQGLRLEDSQIETAERLLKLVAIATHAAAITLQLLQARDGRSGEPASLVFTADELGTLDALHTQYAGTTLRQQNPHPRRSLAWAAWLVARLGGWDGYPSSRPPGPITLKIGIDKLRLLAQGWGLKNVCMP